MIEVEIGWMWIQDCPYSVVKFVTVPAVTARVRKQACCIRMRTTGARTFSSLPTLHMCNWLVYLCIIIWYVSKLLYCLFIYLVFDLLLWNSWLPKLKEIMCVPGQHPSMLFLRCLCALWNQSWRLDEFWGLFLILSITALYWLYSVKNLVCALHFISKLCGLLSQHLDGLLFGQLLFRLLLLFVSADMF